MRAGLLPSLLCLLAAARPARADLLVANSEKDSVLRYDEATGAPRGAFVAAGSGGLDQPRDMAFGPDGALYVASFFTGQVLRYDGATGAFLGVFVAAGSGGLDGPHYFAFGPDANLYVSSFFGRDVLRYDGATGAFLDVFVADGSGGLELPGGLAFGPDDDLYVSSEHTDQVLRYDGASGAFLDVFVAAGSGGLDLPTGLAFGPGGDLYVGGPLAGSIFRYDGSSGAFVDELIGPGGVPIAANGLALGPGDDLYASSTVGDEVLRYDGATGDLLGAFVAAASGGLDVPVGLLFADLPPPPEPSLDPFLAYKAKATRGTPPFAPQSVSLSDALETADAAVRRPAALCNPADVEGGGIGDPALHLAGYAIRSALRHAKRQGLVATTELGALALDTVKPDRLLLPSAQSASAPVDPPADPAIDAFKCYRVKVSRGTPKLPRGTQRRVADEFGAERTLDLKKPTRLCVPAGVDGGAAQDALSHLLCFKAKPARGEPKHAKLAGVHSADAFGQAQRDTLKEEELCLPATLALP